MLISPPKPTEYPAWASVWRAFIEGSNATLPESQFQNSWSRIQDPAGDLHALVARDESGAIVGLVHYVYMPRSWKPAPVVYMEDLFVLPSARGSGYGKQLLLAVAAAGAAKGCDAMHWITGIDNELAQRFYEGIAKSDRMWYRMDLPFNG